MPDTSSIDTPEIHHESGFSSDQPKGPLSPTLMGGIILAVVVVILGYAFVKTQKTSTPTITPSVQTSTPPVAAPETSPTASVDISKQITLTEIAEHNTLTDCWMAIEEDVYDVTPFIAANKHPGGDAILQGCGKDATTMFNSRPNDGTSHDQRARDMLPQYQIGVLPEE